MDTLEEEVVVVGTKDLIEEVVVDNFPQEVVEEEHKVVDTLEVVVREAEDETRVFLI